MKRVSAAPEVRRTRIVVLDHDVNRQSPAGSCVLAEVEALAERHAVTVIASSLDERLQSKVDWLRVPLPRGPVIARYLVFAALAPTQVARARREAGTSNLLVQATEGQYAGADVCYAHFCHRAYLKHYWSQQSATGVRRALRKLNYLFNAWAEARAFSRCRQVVAVSRGLAREIVDAYPFLAGRVVSIPNPVDIGRFMRPGDFDRTAARAAMGLQPEDRVIAFAALGDFARKGLSVLLDALALLPDARIRLLVVGGKQVAEVDAFRAVARERGLGERVVFAGFQPDVQRWLWAADVFALPSIYEAFSLVMIQAAAAGLPVIATPMHGVDEWLEPGGNGWLVERAPRPVADAIADAFSDPFRLVRMGERAAVVAARYSPEAFGRAWCERVDLLLSHDDAHESAAEGC
jgi:glycosyltransferase involved in cell wall biosynthesis